jgi:flagellar biosynthesis/type III secretory pathway chaperone
MKEEYPDLSHSPESGPERNKARKRQEIVGELRVLLNEGLRLLESSETSLDRLLEMSRREHELVAKLAQIEQEIAKDHNLE